MDFSFDDLNPVKAVTEQFSSLFETPKPPPAPDYAGAAEATAEGNIEAARYATVANRPTQITPWGTSTWTQGTEFDQTKYDQALADWQNRRSQYPTTSLEYQRLATDRPVESDFYSPTDRWTQTVSLSPEQQALFNLDQQTSQRMAELGLAGIGSASDLFGSRYQTPTDLPQYQGPSGSMPQYLGVGGNVPQYQRSGVGIPQYAGPQGEIPQYRDAGSYGDRREQVIESMMARTTRALDQEREATHSQLIAYGIPPGSEAYNREMRRIDEKSVDARQQAEIAASQMASQEYRDQLAGEGQRFGAEMQRRGMAGQEAAMTFESAMQSRDADVRDQAQQFINDMQSRGMSRQEAIDMFNNQMASRQQQAAEAQAVYSSGMDRARQLIQNALLERQTPLNELNALRTGTQVSMPQFGQFSQQATTAGPDIFGATAATGQWDLANWNAQQAQQNAILSGLFGIGAAAAGRP